jgi:hypothetical protein
VRTIPSGTATLLVAFLLAGCGGSGTEAVAPAPVGPQSQVGVRNSTSVEQIDCVRWRPAPDASWAGTLDVDPAVAPRAERLLPIFVEHGNYDVEVCDTVLGTIHGFYNIPIYTDTYTLTVLHY